jgi:hypothetical protein
MRETAVWGSKVAVFALLVLASGSVRLPAQGSYQITVFDVPSSTGTVPASINDAGAIVGYYYTGSFQTPDRGFQRSPEGAITEVSPPLAGFVSYAYGINSQLIVGSYIDTSGLNHGFTFNGQQYTTIDIDGQPTNLFCISNSGLVGGAIYSSGGEQSESFVRSLHDGIFPVRYPGSYYTYPDGVNDSGQVVGTFIYTPGADSQGFVFSPGTGYAVIAYPGAYETFPNGINDRGTIVGRYAAQTGFQSGFVLKEGTFTSFLVGRFDAYPAAINNRGDITGYFIDSQDHTHGFLATFVPPPAAPSDKVPY